MKPNFALDLSHDGIGLLHRGRKGWLRVGEVALDDPVMRGTLAMLRRTAADLSSGGMTTKLVLPASQILYMKVEAPGPTPAERDSQIRAALEGRTPYAVGDLVYDHSASGTRCKIAVVARETLEEAEAFAVEHRFNPVCFVARPEKDEFDGEPWFGETRHAQSLLNGEPVEPDGEAVTVRGSVSLPDPAPADDKTPLEPTDAHQAAPADYTDRASEQSRTAAKATKVAASTTGTAATVAAAEATATGGPKAMAPETTASVAAPQDTQKSAKSARNDSAAQGDSGSKDTPAEAQALAEGAAFSTRRAAPTLGSPLGQSLNPKLSPTLGQNLGRTARFSMGAPALGAAAPSAGSDDGKPISDTAAETAQPDTAAQTTTTTRGAPQVAPLPDPPEPGPRAIARGFSAKWSAGADVAQSNAGPDAGARPQLGAAQHAARANISDTDPGDADTTGTGALSVPTGGFPVRQGVMLTLLLLLALASIAVISTLMAKNDLIGVLSSAEAELADATFLPPMGYDDAPLTARRPTPRPATELFDIAQEDPATDPEATPERITSASDSAPTALFGPDLPMAQKAAALAAAQPSDMLSNEPVRVDASVQDLVLDTPDEVAHGIAPLAQESVGRAAFSAPELGRLQPADAQDLLALVAPDESTRPSRRPPPSQRATPPEDATTADGPTDPDLHYAATGVWITPPDLPPAPPATAADTPAGLNIASSDPAVVQQDAVALPLAVSTDDLRPPTQASPAASATRFVLDDRGLVRPTPEGTLSPEGIIVFAGRPDPLPLPRPQDASPAAKPAPAQAALRPSPRPGDLIEQNKQLKLAALPRDKLAMKRPNMRADAKKDTDTSPADTADIVPDAKPDPIEGATKLAVKSSVKPSSRPPEFASLIRKARATRMKNVSMPDPKAAPRLPTRTSVAREATQTNVLNLSSISLIGVYGSSSNRRALVRLPSGRFTKVEVGDRMDGGRVLAIDEESLRYTKSGRNVVLSMPRS